MTRDEVAAVVSALGVADGGCSSCIRHLMNDLISRLPGEPWLEVARASTDVNTKDAVEEIDKEAERAAKLAAEEKERETFIPEWARK